MGREGDSCFANARMIRWKEIRPVLLEVASIAMTLAILFASSPAPAYASKQVVHPSRTDPLPLHSAIDSNLPSGKSTEDALLPASSIVVEKRANYPAFDYGSAQRDCGRPIAERNPVVRPANANGPGGRDGVPPLKKRYPEFRRRVGHIS